MILQHPIDICNIIAINNIYNMCLTNDTYISINLNTYSSANASVNIFLWDANLLRLYLGLVHLFIYFSLGE